MTPDIEKITDADKAYEEFAAQPLVKEVGVDRASFCAGFDTCAERYQHLEAALPVVVEKLRYMDGWLKREIEGVTNSSAAHARGHILEAIDALLDKKP